MTIPSAYSATIILIYYIHICYNISSNGRDVLCQLNIERHDFLRRTKVAVAIYLIVLGVIGCIACFLAGGLLTDRHKEGTGVMTVAGIICLFLSFWGVLNISAGKPTSVDNLSTDSIYVIQARFPYNDGVHSVVVLKTNADDPNNGFRLVRCDSKELPDVDLVKVKDKKFIPFSLCQETR